MALIGFTTLASQAKEPLQPMWKRAIFGISMSRFVMSPNLLIMKMLLELQLLIYLIDTPPGLLSISVVDKPLVAAHGRQGLPRGTDLRSGAIATGWGGSAYSLGFGFNGNTVNGGYQQFFGTADVINSSWGGTDPAGASSFPRRFDGWAAQNPQTTLVTSAGNSGPNGNTIGYPGSGYNAITVGALENGGNNAYNTVASFSSRGPQDYFDPTNGNITGVRAAVDIAAPGTNLTAAFYGGQTGGNNTTLPGSVNDGANSNFYSLSVSGTSFASPIVAGGVSLIKSASYNTPELASNLESRHPYLGRQKCFNE